MGKTMNKKIADYAIISFACFLQAFAIVCILKPSHLTVGGITGLALAIEKLFKFNYSYVYWILCILVLLAAKIFLGIKEAKKIILLFLLSPSHTGPYSLTLKIVKHVCIFPLLAFTDRKSVV